MLYDDNPHLFLSFFTRGVFDAPLTVYLEKRLRERGVFLYRLNDDRRVGEDWAVAAARKMRDADGTLCLWTRGAMNSNPVREEVRFALEKNLPICLLKEEGIELPESWPERKLFVKLRGIDPVFSLGLSIFVEWSCVERQAMTSMLDEITQFAWRAHASRRR